MSPSDLLMLEDNAERIARFRSVLHRIDPTLDLHIWRDAHAMIREAGVYLPRTLLLSLDHDLEPETPDSPDPGEGYMVAQWLVSQPIVRPVIIHTSNSERATWMAGAFDLEHWRHYRVLPVGEDWIENDWRRIVRRIVKKATRLSSESLADE